MKKLISIITILLIFTVSVSCKKEKTISITEEVIEEEMHTIEEKHVLSGTRTYNLLAYDFIPFYYNDKWIESFYSCQEFDNFMKKISQENKYNFFLPLFFDDPIFSKNNYESRIDFEFISDYDTIYTNCLKIGEEYDPRSGRVKTLYKTLEEANYELVTDYLKITEICFYSKKYDENKKFNYDFTVKFYTCSGKIITDYYDLIYQNTNKAYDINDVDNFKYNETRFYQYRDESTWESFNNAKSTIVIYDNSLYNAYIDILIYIDQDTIKDINNNNCFDEKKLDAIKDDLNEIYDFVYNKLIEYGYKTYSNISR